MSRIVLDQAPLGFPWTTVDPFLFCAYHNDAFPKGNGNMGPDPALLRGRNLGMDFEVKDGFRMYHGHEVPGFPSHPHRGFETVTLVRRGYCDHSDSLGAAARFGAGDAQWVTAGAGIVHAEMFPLLDDSAENPLELFQIWLNLPSDAKMAEPGFRILWGQDIPEVVRQNAAGKRSVVRVVAGAFEDVLPPAPPPHSWASRPGSDVAIWTIEMEAGAEITLPKAASEVNRAIYFFEGDRLRIGDDVFDRHGVFLVQPDVPAPLAAEGGKVGLLVLSGKPIGQPVAQHGPFVMNTRAELVQAFEDYQRTRFGGWPWPEDAPVHGKERGRFARHADGHVEEFPRAGGSSEASSGVGR